MSSKIRPKSIATLFWNAFPGLNSHGRLELSIYFVIAISAYLYGQSIYIQNLDVAGFYQSHFLAPLHFACAGTYESFSPNAAVLEFLVSPRAVFEGCDDVASLPDAAWSRFEAGLIFLLGLAGLSWKLLGISWANLAPIAGILTAALALSAYGLFRVFCRYPVIAVAMTVVFMTHSSVVGQIMQLRDFSKAPFMVATLALTAAVTVGPQTVRTTLLTAAAIGAIIAIALGFRPDVMAIMPIALASPVFMLGAVSWRQWLHRASAMWLGLAVGFYLLHLCTIAITPPIAASNNFISHVFILGFAEVFSAGFLEIADASYRLASAYLDDYAIGLVHLFYGGAPTDYDAASRDMLFASVVTAPHDVLIRIFYSAQAMHKFVPLIWGPLLLGAICLLWIARRRELLFLSFSFASLTAIASLQFEPRHVFFFGVFGLSLICLIIDWGLHAWQTRSPAPTVATIVRSTALAASVIVGLSVSLGLLSLVTLRLQEENVAQGKLFYEGLEWSPIAFVRDQQRLTPDQSTFLRGTAQPDQPNPISFARLTMRSQADATSCAEDGSSVTQTYLYVGVEHPLKPWPLSTGVVQELYFPMVNFPNLEFTHLEFLGDISGCDIEWQVASDFPAGTVPLELMVIDGQIHADHRGSWAHLGAKFLYE